MKNRVQLSPHGDNLPVGLHNALMRCNSLAELRAMHPLPDEAQRVIDDAVVRVGLERLTVVADIMAAGLITKLDDPLSVMELYHEKESKVGHARRTMLPGSRGERQVIQRSGVRTPIYATMEEFSFNIRPMRASQRVGAPLDVSHVEQAVRRVNESIEDAAINGAGVIVGGNSVPGLLNAPNVNTQAYVGNEAWTAASHTGEEIVADVLAMIDDLQADEMFGPYHMWVPTTYGNKLNQDFKSATSGTILERLLAINVGGQNLRISVADRLPQDRTVMAQMTTDVLDIIDGQRPTVIAWEDGPGWNLHFAVIAFVIPRVKDTYDAQSGIVTGDLN